jgi:Ca2+-binding EF-hand superfamily protein
VFIHSDLLADQKKVIDIMEQPHVDSKKIDDELKKHFRSIDKENIGVITHPEFITLIKNIGVKLNPSEEKDLLKKVDP